MRWLVLLLYCGLACAQGYPSKPVKLVTPFPPGGSADVIARLTAQRLAENFGQPAVVDNRGGAGGLVGTEYAAKQPPDGYTLVLITGAYPVQAAMLKSMPFDPPVCHQRARRFAVSLTRRPDRRGEGASRQAELSLLGNRHGASPVGRAAQRHGRHRHDARAVPRRREPADRGARRARRPAARGDDAVDRADPVGEAARARRHLARALEGAAECAERCRDGARV
ncbi:MAG: hypothetical protein E6H57_02550 [Betaproteobacteria bacterium]|nr:MAG: hypothetical protein E6H57_02550 [Betaproteobacteria bacterium]